MARRPPWQRATGTLAHTAQAGASKKVAPVRLGDDLARFLAFLINF
jgi:hypothetical protein